MPVSHTFVSAIADDPAASAAGEVLPSHWNASHTMSVILTSEVTGILPVANGGTGNATGAATTNANLTGPITSVGNATSVAAQTGTGSTFVMDTSPTLVTPNIGTATGAGLILTSASATAFAVGPNGATTPSFQVDGSVTSAATGFLVTPAAAGVAPTIQVQGAAGNIGAVYASKGTGVCLLQSSTTGSCGMRLGSNTRLTITDSAITFNFGIVTSGVNLRYSYPSTGSDTGLTAGTEAPIAYYNFGGNRQHASNTAITTQRDFRITGTTHSFATSGGVITDAAAFSVDGPPIGGTNATLTNSHAIYIPALALSNVTNGYGLTVNAPSGAGTINAAVKAGGDVLITGNVKLQSAGNGLQIKSGSNARVGTGVLTGGTQTVANTSVTASTLVFLTDTSTSVTNVGSLTVVTTAGVGFVVTSTLALDTSTYNWMLIESI